MRWKIVTTDQDQNKYSFNARDLKFAALVGEISNFEALNDCFDKDELLFNVHIIKENDNDKN